MDFPALELVVNNTPNDPNEANEGWSKKPNSKKERKIKFQHLLKLLQKTVVLKERQLEYSKTIENNIITICTGPAGASKSYSAVYTLLKLLFEEKIEKIIFTKPVVEAGESLGFLPGDIESKIGPYMESFIFICQEMIGKQFTDFLIESEFIENKPLAYMRGITLKNCGLFLDELQNTTYQQVMLFVTRIGEGSLAVLAGDVSQSDIKKSQVFQKNFLNIFTSIESVASFKFYKEDIVRSKILIDITDNYEKWKIDNN